MHGVALLERWQPVDLNGDPHEAAYRGDPVELVDAAGFLLALITRPAWMDDAACREHPELSWFPGQGEDVRAAKAVCVGCLVRQECRDYAAEHGPLTVGIWGGTSDRERRTARRTAA